ncbi:MAG: hypothetical protein H6Q73_165 [Firmicutes bacterium]|nr:hypothetical protein [Bacillota bacterium]
MDMNVVYDNYNKECRIARYNCQPKPKVIWGKPESKFEAVPFTPSDDNTLALRMYWKVCKREHVNGFGYYEYNTGKHDISEASKDVINGLIKKLGGY